MSVVLTDVVVRPSWTFRIAALAFFGGIGALLAWLLGTSGPVVPWAIVVPLFAVLFVLGLEALRQKASFSPDSIVITRYWAPAQRFRPDDVELWTHGEKMHDEGTGDIWTFYSKGGRRKPWTMVLLGVSKPNRKAVVEFMRSTRPDLFADRSGKPMRGPRKATRPGGFGPPLSGPIGFFLGTMVLAGLAVSSLATMRDPVNRWGWSVGSLFLGLLCLYPAYKGLRYRIWADSSQGLVVRKGSKRSRWSLGEVELVAKTPLTNVIAGPVYNSVFWAIRHRRTQATLVDRPDRELGKRNAQRLHAVLEPLVGWGGQDLEDDEQDSADAAQAKQAAA